MLIYTIDSCESHIREIRYMKTYTSEINGIKYSLCVEEPLYSEVQSLFQAMKTIPQGKLKNGFKLQIGFSVFILVETAEGYQIVTPDYTNNPFLETTEDLTLALWIQSEQTDLLRLYHLTGETVRFDDKIVVAENVLQKEQISLQRFTDLGESGWCAGEIKKGEDGKYFNVTANAYESYYIYQLLKIRPALIKALVLPYEYIVVFEGDNIIEILNGQNESII